MDSFLIFHVLVEMFSVIVAWGILTVALNSRRFLRHSFFLFLGVAYAAVGLIDLVHTLAFKGMGVFPGYTADLPTQLWIAARYVNAVALLLAPLFLTRRVRLGWIVLPFMAAAFLLLTAAFTGWFPECFREDAGGLTPFKVISEYVICALVAAAMAFLWHRRQYLEKTVLRWLLISMALTIAAEMAFTLYAEVTDLLNISGHLFKIAAFGFLYQATVVVGLRRPYDVLFGDLKLSEQRYRNLVSDSPDAIIVMKDGKPLFANAAALELYGAADFDALARCDIMHLIAAPDRTVAEDHIRRATAELGKPVHELHIIRLNGKQLPVEVRFSSIEYGGNSAIQMIMRDLSERLKAEKSLRQHNEEMRRSRAATLNLLQDAIDARQQAERTGDKLRQEIAERKVAEEALRQSREDLAHAQSVGSIGSWRLDVRKNELIWSDEAHRIFGIPKGTPMTYEKFLSTVHPDDRDYVDARWQAALAGEMYDIEHRIVANDKILWVREKANLEFNEKGELTGAFGITQDITHRKLMQEKLRQAYEQMEGRVKQRTVELADTVDSLEEEVRQRMAAEKALKQSERQYRLLVEVSPEPVCVVVDEKVAFLNTAAMQLLGTDSLNGIVGRSMWDLVHPDSAGIVRSDIETLLVKKGKTPTRELTLLRLNGMPVEVEITATAIEHQGQPGILTVFHDITERKRIEQQTHTTNVLLEQFTRKASRKEYLDSVVKVIHDWSGCHAVGIRLTDPNGWIPYVSCIGFTPEFLAAEDHLSLHNSESCLCIRAITQNTETSDAPMVTQRGSFHSSNTFDFLNSLNAEEKSRYRPNCMRHGYATLAVVPIRYHGQVIGAIHLADKQKNKISSDAVSFLETMAMLIGEAVHRFNVEESLQASRERLLEAQRIAHIGNWEWDIKTGSIFWSDEIYRIFGLEPGQSEAAYESFFNYAHPDDRELLHETIAAALIEGTYTVDHRIITHDGRQRIVHGKGEVTYDSSRNPVKLAGILYDITEQKHAEEAIREYQRTLRSMAAELQLVEERERRQIAQDLHDSIGPILAFSSREIQTIKKYSPPKIASALQEVSEKMDEAIQQARTLSFDLSPSLLYDLGFEVAVEDLVDRFAAERKISCEFQTDPHAKPLSEDVKIVLYRSVRELLINAAKYAEAEFVTVSVNRLETDVRVTVEDDGKGFDVSTLEEESEKAKGFGLFSIRERLTHIGGTLEISSIIGKGTTITLTAPLDLENLIQ